jgi:hypothetical protein
MMKKLLAWLVALLTVLVLTGSLASGDIIVNSLEDRENPPQGTVTLRSALAKAASNETIRFDRRLNGDTIELSIVGEEHSMLVGEVMGIREEESGPVSYLVGYFERDYGRSALYARKNVVIDASSLPSGITLRWVGGEENPARVLAVYGNLTMTNVSVTGGRSVAEEIPQGIVGEHEQLSTRARGAGVAVWGIAQLTKCTIYDNHCERDVRVPARSRDAGVFGGGVYADIVEMQKCVVSGNSVSASGVSGGGVFSVGGAQAPRSTSTIDQSAITGNRISGIFAYGGGAYSDGGGIGKRNTLAVTNSTIARNLVEPLPGLPGFMYGIGYWRGGGLYMSNGYMQIHGSTIVENQVYGKPRTDSLDRPNLAGGVAATIGNAHAVEQMRIGHSVIAGNTVHEVDLAEGGGFAPGVVYNQDIFTGSLLHFKSRGYNRFGVVDFSQILVPVGEPTWETFSRRHYPKAGDEDGVAVADVLDQAEGVELSDTILSVGVDAGQPAVLYYQPKASALDQIPTLFYRTDDIYAEYNISLGVRNDFLAILLDRLEVYYELDEGFSEGFVSDFEAFLGSVDLDDDTEGLQPYTDPSENPILTLGDTLWFGPAVTWPKILSNHPYIHFWHRLDRALLDAQIPGIGSEVLGETDWAALFPSGPLNEGEDPEIVMTSKTAAASGFPLLETDQRSIERPVNELGDIGAIELTAPVTPLTREQQMCVNEMNKRGAKVNKVQLKQNERCLMDFQREKLIAPMTFDSCMAVDRKDKVLRAWRRTVTRESAKCASLDAPPPFAYTDSATVNGAAEEGALMLTYAIFGRPVLDADLVTMADSKDTARCQLEMLKRANKLENTILKEVNKTKKQALKDEAVGNDTTLEARLQAVFSSNRNINRAQNTLARGVDRKCSALQAHPDEIFPGKCSEGDPNLGEVEDCVIAAARCEACSMIKAFDGLRLDCDQADDQTRNESCDERAYVGTRTNADCFPTSVPDSAPEIAKICVGLANTRPDMPFTPTDYQGLPEDCKAIVHPECR